MEYVAFDLEDMEGHCSLVEIPFSSNSMGFAGVAVGYVRVAQYLREEVIPYHRHHRRPFHRR